MATAEESRLGPTPDRLSGGVASTREALGQLRKDAAAMAGGFVVLLVVGGAVFAPFVAPYGPSAQDQGAELVSPSTSHLLGTDALGRDVFTRILYGGRTALLTGIGAVTIALVVGACLGIAVGYYGRVLDAMVMRAIDLLLAFPLFILAILLVVVMGPGLLNLIIAVGVSQIPVFTRLARSLTLSLRKHEFIEAAVAIGSTDRRIFAHHLLPNLFGSLVAMATTTVGLAILYAAALNFLGIGIQPPTADWGRMAAENATLIFTHPWLSAYPGAAIAVTALALNLLGDGLVRLVDPAARKGSWL